MFITFFYGLLDGEKNAFIYFRTGHNAAILVRKNGSQMELGQGGLALGILRNAKYQQEEINLKHGDKILIFTDGVTKAMNPQNEEFGEERLNKLLLN